MCGIAGFYGQPSVIGEQQLVAMTNQLQHRGPDAKGYFYNGKVGLGHRRLSILDLSVSSNQPFTSSSGRYTIVYNGEVYNYKELAEILDVPLKTTGDTEVIVEMFAKYGPDFVSKLNGMFAFVIYDQLEQKIHIFRDRLGVKPLFYYWNGSAFVFASELKSFHSLDFIDKRINKGALNDFLKMGYIPEPHTIFENIRKFPSGTYASIEKQELVFVRYWSVFEKINKEVISNYNQAKTELKNLLESSVRYRMISDVSFGTFLSGGIDSSLVTAIASSVSNTPLKTFSIGFKDQAFDESKYAKKVSDFLKTEHHELIVSEKEAIEHFEAVMEHFDEPYADTSALPTYLVSKLASQHVKMVLTGDGGDELFMGYGAYRWAQRLSNPLYTVLKGPFAAVLRNIGSNKYKRISHMLDFPSENRKRHIFSQEQYLFAENELSDILRKEYVSESNFSEKSGKVNRSISEAEQQALFDIQYYLKDDLLTKVDRVSMLCSIEAREPLLDYRLVEFAMNLPEKFKMRGDQSKIILKDVLYDYIPQDFFNRPKKGFSVPLAAWLRSDLSYLIDEYLSLEKINSVGIFEFKAVDTIVKKFRNGNDYLYNRVFALITIQKWFIHNKLR